MIRHAMNVFLLACLPAVGLAVELEKVHPDERATVAALQKVYGLVELNPQGRVAKLHVPLGGTLGDEHMPLVASLCQLERLDLANSHVGHNGLIYLKKLPRLRVLHLPQSLRRAFETPSENWAKAFWTFERKQNGQDGSGELRMSDAGLAHLAQLRQLEELGLGFTWTSDEGLKSLANLTALRKLNLAATEVSDAGMVRLKHFDRLTDLVLDDTDVGDAGLMRLAALSNLESLSLKQTLASFEGVEHLRVQLPALRVTPEILPVRGQVEAVRALRHAEAEVELDERGRAVRVSNPRKEDVYDLGVLVRVFAELEGIEDSQERERALRTLGREISLSRIRPLPALTTLRELDLKGLVLENDDLAPVGNLIELRRLDLRETDITDEALRHLVRLSKLESLKLTDTNTTFGGVMGLLVEKHKRSVPEALAVVGQATLDANGNITELYVRRPHVTDESIKYLKQLTTLTDLDLTECDVSDAGLIQVAEFAHVRSLNLAGTRVTDGGLKHIAAMKQLEVLNLDDTDVTDAGIVTLASLASLDTLTLRDTHVSQEAVEKLRAEIPDLGVEPRTLPKAQIVEHVAAIRRDGVWFSYDREGDLVTILFDPSATTDDDLQSLAKIKTLKQLSLRGDLMSEEGVSHLPQLANLDHLGARGVPVTNQMLKHIGRLTRLKWLSLIDTEVDDRGLVHLKDLSNLEWVGLSGTNVTDAGLPHLKKLDRLDRLDLRDTQVTDQGVKQLRQALPKCEIER